MDPTNSLGIQNLSCKINKIKYLKALVKNKAGFPYKNTLVRVQLTVFFSSEMYTKATFLIERRRRKFWGLVAV